MLAATLRSVRNLDIAEESTADAFLLALQTWPHQGVPRSVEAWLITVARRRAVDRVRRAQAERRALITESGGWTSMIAGPEQLADAALVGDDELRMVVLCCDPRLGQDDQVALTLRLACGVSTAAIAAGFGVSTPTMAARLTRAKAKLAGGGPQLDLPDDATVDERLPAVAMVVYLVFTLGHTTGDGDALTDEDLQDRAQYLARVLTRLRPRYVEFVALLALILLTRARAGGRFDDAGDQIVLRDADRSRWNGPLRDQGIALANQAMQAGPAPLTLQAAIAAEHARAADWAQTDWPRVLDLYSQLLTVDPSHTVAVGRCIALAQVNGAAAGLADLDEVLGLGGLDRYPYAFAARAHLLAELGWPAEASQSWLSAAGCARNATERTYFAERARRAAAVE